MLNESMPMHLKKLIKANFKIFFVNLKVFSAILPLAIVNWNKIFFLQAFEADHDFF